MAKLIYIEGPKGSGKTTLINKLKESYQGELVVVAEPSGDEKLNPIGLALREIIKGDLPREPLTEALLFQAARVETYEKEIKPHLNKEDCLILVDRSIISAYVYQFFNKGVELVPELHFLTMGETKPADMTIWLFPTFEEVRRRLESRNDNFDSINPAATADDFWLYTKTFEQLATHNQFPSLRHFPVTSENIDDVFNDTLSIINALKSDKVNEAIKNLPYPSLEHMGLSKPMTRDEFFDLSIEEQNALANAGAGGAMEERLLNYLENTELNVSEMGMERVSK